MEQSDEFESQPVNRSISTKLLGDIWLDTRNMARYAQSRGLKVEPPDIVLIQHIEQFVSRSDRVAWWNSSTIYIDSPELARDLIAQLSEVHFRLCKLIAPVVPQGTRYSIDTAKWYHFLGDAPAIVSTMLLVTLAFLFAFIYIGGNEYVTAELLETGLLYRNPLENWLVGLTYMSAAGLGACLYNLHAMYGYIVSRTYDPAYQSSYWVRLIIGIVSGFVLAEVFTIDISGDLKFDKPLLAFLGGFSSDAVEAILRRLVDALVTLVKGRVKAGVENAEIENKAKAEQIKKRFAVETLKQLNQEKQELLAQGADPKIIEAIDKLISSVLDNS